MFLSVLKLINDVFSVDFMNTLVSIIGTLSIPIIISAWTSWGIDSKEESSWISLQKNKIMAQPKQIVALTAAFIISIFFCGLIGQAIEQFKKEMISLYKIRIFFILVFCISCIWTFRFLYLSTFLFKTDIRPDKRYDKKGVYLLTNTKVKPDKQLEYWIVFLKYASLTNRTVDSDNIYIDNFYNMLIIASKRFAELDEYWFNSFVFQIRAYFDKLQLNKGTKDSQINEKYLYLCFKEELRNRTALSGWFNLLKMQKDYITSLKTSTTMDSFYFMRVISKLNNELSESKNNEGKLKILYRYYVTAQLNAKSNLGSVEELKITSSGLKSDNRNLYLLLDLFFKELQNLDVISNDSAIYNLFPDSNAVVVLKLYLLMMNFLLLPGVTSDENQHLGEQLLSAPDKYKIISTTPVMVEESRLKQEQERRDIESFKIYAFYFIKIGYYNRIVKRCNSLIELLNDDRWDNKYSNRKLYLYLTQKFLEILKQCHQESKRENQNN
ncbi:hypothetical protein [Lactobacillus psittaci]|uniref:Uncharacterized protein n=1 Tax=Lactobacillus psittaci DSM 15354 TaxID=1122152 RepID=A0A0R1SCQ8_9LACO|nr:hypothetical protein [Lactobacillus psittaci]KRL63067.1 hypothetical protein FC23_GL001004 [Lactobacillus psittaci DSM 15354]